MHREDVERAWPERLKIRDTGLHDDLGGPGQRIYTTAGRGYERVEYVRADLYAALLAERDTLQRQLNDLRNGWANSVKAHSGALAERDAAFAAGLQSAVTICKRVRSEVAENEAEATGALECALAIMDEVNDLAANPRP